MLAKIKSSLKFFLQNESRKSKVRVETKRENVMSAR